MMSAEHPTSPKLYTTKDGSHTLYSEQFGQYYHNPNGACSESLHVFFEQNGLLEALQQNKSLNILEMGFGSGLNFFILLHFLNKKNVSLGLEYHSIEAFPLKAETALNIDFGDFFEDHSYQHKLQKILTELKAGKNLFSFGQAALYLHFEDLQHAQLPENYFDFVFYDPFSPEASPDCWTAEAFRSIYLSMKKKGLLSTYCAASSARPAMAKSGFFVARAKGALGKREMTLASPEAGRLGNHKRLNEKRLIQRWDAGEFE